MKSKLSVRVCRRVACILLISIFMGLGVSCGEKVQKEELPGKSEISVTSETRETEIVNDSVGSLESVQELLNSIPGDKASFRVESFDLSSFRSEEDEYVGLNHVATSETNVAAVIYRYTLVDDEYITEPQLVLFDLQGKPIKEMSLSLMFPNLFFDEYRIVAMFLDQEGVVRMVLQILPHKKSSEKPQYIWALVDTKEESILSQNPVKTDASEKIKEEDFADFHVDRKGYLYVYAGNFSGENKNFVMVFDEKGQEIFRIKDEKNTTQSWWFPKIFFSYEGRVYFLSRHTEPNSLAQSTVAIPVDFEEQAFGEKVTLDKKVEEITGSFFAGTGSPMYIGVDGVYELDINSGKGSAILLWKNQDIIVEPDSQTEIAPISEEKILVGTTRYNDEHQGMEPITWYILTKESKAADKKSDSEKEIIEILDFYEPQYSSGSSIERAAYRFNQKSNEYIIEVKNMWTMVSNPNNFTEVIPEINKMILSGNTPDAVIMNHEYMDYYYYAHKGLLADLYPLMEKEEKYRKENYIPEVLAAVEIEGKLFYMPTGFILSGYLAGRKSLVGDIDAITLSEFDRLAGNIKNDQKALYDAVHPSTLLIRAIENQSEIFDREANVVNFTSQPFIDALHFAKKHKIPETEWDRSLFEMKFQLGYTSLYPMEIDRVAYYAEFWNKMDEPIDFFTYPSDVPQKGTADLWKSFAIFEESKHKEIVWHILKELIADPNEVHVSNNEFIMPIRIKELERQITNAVNPPTVDSFGFPIESHLIPQPLSQEGADALWEMIHNIGYVSSYFEVDSYKYKLIIIEESQAFFSDQKSAEEVAAIIQSRVMTLMNS